MLQTPAIKITVSTYVFIMCARFRAENNNISTIHLRDDLRGTSSFEIRFFFKYAFETHDLQ